MITYWILNVLVGSMKIFIKIFPNMEDFDIPNNVLGFIRGASSWIDVNTFNLVINLIMMVYLYMGMSFVINWVIKRIRGG